jgi:DNA primase
MNDMTHRMQKVAEAFNLNLRNKSPKGWIYGGTCPFCNRSDKFGIKLNYERGKYRNHVSFNCFHGSCQEKGSEFKLLKEVGLLHLISDGEFIGEKDKLEQLTFISEEVDIDDEVPTKHKPFGYRRVDSDPYLNGRGFKPWQYQTYNVGRTKMYDPLKDYVIFLIEEDGENKGYVARLTWSKEKIKQQEDLGRLVLRYKNEGGVDFGKLLFGIDEIVSEVTKRVILVEGVTDKANVDKLLRLNLNEKTKCCCSFGKKISEEQIFKLWKKGVEQIVVLYDPDAVDASKQYSYQLKLWFNNVKVGYIHSNDPGDVDRKELLEVLKNAETPGTFDVMRVQKFNLK